MGYTAWLQAVPVLKTDLPVPLIASVAKNYVTPSVAAEQAEALSEAGVDGVTLCDYNVPALIEAVRLARPRVKCRLFAKLIPFIPNLEEVLQALLKAGIDGIAAMDAVGPAMEVDIETGLSTMGSPDGEGYLSGRAIRPLTVRYIYEISRYVNVPVIAVGGVTNAESAIEMLMVGATAVGMCTAPLLHGLEVFDKVATAMERWLGEHGFADVNEIRGLTHRRQAKREITSDKRAAVDMERCTQCGRCVRSCFAAAPELVNSMLVIHTERCTGCGLCVSICPVDALSLR
jgi:NAD-dependent dihydropyrimidine dehydrogenase PreA subunit